MVKTVKRGGKTYNVCEACDYGYLDEETARACEAWCTKHKSCNLEITKKGEYLGD
ncbi:MAG: hypothetical protein HYS81_03435 [Candidatus Aenigmatarchaeota archaeon]|nr:MAG: hypothetical protein HYS81_03435 [Candidatus Aenigmarchaeota archaeon]